MNFSNRINIDFGKPVMFQVVYNRITRNMQDWNGLVFAIPFKIDKSELDIGVKARIIDHIITDLLEILDIIISKGCIEKKMPTKLCYFFDVIPVCRFFFFWVVEFVNRFVGARGKHYTSGEGGYNKGEAFHRVIGLRG